ncbi:cysteine hydrolase family protein [Martelella soudanensis]|uniref:cysteine hydrolase family protein n=1 Tax=unclassified Martelella TaxID=2629616 RepID=UPI001AEDC434|nr:MULTISPECIES: isochorismatase family cysteine hydrolase [unclassified Martelella]
MPDDVASLSMRADAQAGRRHGGLLTRRQFAVAAAGVFAAAPVKAGETNANEPGSQKVDAMALTPEKTALVLLHYQTDILALFEDAGIDAYVRRMDRLAEAARAAGIPVFFVKVGFSADYREIAPLNKNGQMIKSFGLFTADSIAPTLLRSGDIVITAHRVSGFHGTALQAMLADRGIDTLIMAGIATSGVVVSTLSEASDLDFRILLVEDGCFDPDRAVHDALVSVPFSTRADILSADEAVAMINR